MWLSRIRRMHGRLAIWPVVIACVASLASPQSTAAESADGDALVEEIVVVASKYPQPRSEVAANVSVFGRDAQRFELAASVADTFRYAPAIQYETAGVRFGAESINIRGISGNRVAILVDGIPLSEHFAVGSFSNASRDLVDAGLVEQIEVLHGPASALYGSAAIGGVVALQTPSISSGGGVDGRLYTSFDDARRGRSGTLLQSVGGRSYGVLAAVTHTLEREPDSAAAGDRLDTRQVRRDSALLKFQYRGPDGGTWRATGIRRSASTQSALASLLGSSRFRQTTALTGDDDSRSDIVGLEYRFHERWPSLDAGVVRLWHQSTDIAQVTEDQRGLASRPVAIWRAFEFVQRASGAEINLARRFELGAFEHRLGFGIDYRQRRTRELRDAVETGIDDGVSSNTLLGEVFPLRDFPLTDTRELGAFVEDVVRRGPWTLIAALRLDHFDMRPEVDRIYREDYPFATPVSIAEREVSPKFGLVYRISADAEAYLQYAHGFRAPPYEDANLSLDIPLFNYRAIPNADLRAERSDGFEAGIRWRSESLQLALAVFTTDYRDFIASRVRLGPDPVSGRVLFQAQNIHRARIRGIEASGTLSLEKLLDRLHLRFGMFSAAGEDRDAGLPLNSVGPAQAVLGLEWASPRDAWRLALRSRVTDDWSDRDESSGALFKPPGHALTDLLISRRFGPHAELRLALRNIADRSVWSWSQVRGLSPDDPVLPYVAQPGRSVSLGIDVFW